MIAAGVARRSAFLSQTLPNCCLCVGKKAANDSASHDIGFLPGSPWAARQALLTTSKTGEADPADENSECLNNKGSRPQLCVTGLVSGVRTEASICRLATLHRRHLHDGLEHDLGHVGDGNREDVPGAVGPEQPEPSVARVSDGTLSDATYNLCVCRIWSGPRRRRTSVSALACFGTPNAPSNRHEI